MSYEKVKIIGVRQAVKKDSGQVYKFLQVELFRSHDIFLNDEAVKLIDDFNAFKGCECLLPLAWSQYQGRDMLNLSEDFRPLPLPSLNK